MTEQEEVAKQHIDSGPFRHAAIDEILCRLLEEFTYYGPTHKQPGAKRILLLAQLLSEASCDSSILPCTWPECEALAQSALARR